MLITLAKLQLCNCTAFLLKTWSSVIRCVLVCGWVPGTWNYMGLCPAIFCLQYFSRVRFCPFSKHDTGSTTPACDATLALQTFPLVVCWGARRLRFGCWPGKGEDVHFICLLQLCLLANAQGAVAQLWKCLWPSSPGVQRLPHRHSAGGCEFLTSLCGCSLKR